MIDEPNREQDQADLQGSPTGPAADAAGSQPADSPAPAGDRPEPGAPEAGATETPEPTADLQAELEEARRRALRLQAELENFRKRTQRTMEEERRYAALPLIRDLLAVVDNLQRAIDAAEQNENASGLLEGVKMVAEQLSSVLKQHHCEPIEAEGKPFDPNMHEAIGQLPSDTHAPGTVTHVINVGYKLHDRVVRPSKVMIAAPSDGDDAAKEETEEK